jgi:hypothetical protein
LDEHGLRKDSFPQVGPIHLSQVIRRKPGVNLGL